MPRIRNDKPALAIALREVFRMRGWNGASLSDLSAATGLSRASLYHHFPNGKADMAAAALADVEARLVTEILSCIDGEEPPEQRLAAMAEVLRTYYGHGDLGCLLGALSQGASEHGLGARIAATFEAWIASLTRLAVEADVSPERAHENAVAMVAALQGALVLVAGTGSRRAFDVVLARLSELLFARGPVAP